MYSTLVPFEEILEGIKDDTGITNITNFLPKIRRLVFRAERDIGFGGSTVLKKIKYKVSDGSIITSGDQYKIKIPKDLIFIEEVGMCNEGVCPGDYVIQNNYLFFCKSNKIQEFSFIYYALICDPEGNPIVPENHREAVISGVCMYMYRTRRFSDKGNGNTYQQMENYYHDRIAEARGDDFMPTTAEEWRKAASMMQMSSRDIMMYDNERACFCVVPESTNPFAKAELTNKGIFSFQFDNLLDTIDNVNIVTDSFIENQGTLHNTEDLLNGKQIAYKSVGRIGWAIYKDTPDFYSIHDVLDNKTNDISFDKFFDQERGIEILISKEYYTPSNVYFKFKTS